MKRFIMVMIICCLGQLQLASAQSAEFQQLILNIEKLAQLKQILKDLKNGYDIASKGYQRIRDISQGNTSLHQIFLDGLLAVNPELRKYERVADIIAGQKQILSEYRSAYSRYRSNGQFSPAEIVEMEGTYNKLLSRSMEDLNELTLIITAGELRMSDDERIRAINRVYAQVEDKLVFLRGLNRNIGKEERRRLLAKKGLEAMKTLHEK